MYKQKSEMQTQLLQKNLQGLQKKDKKEKTEKDQFKNMLNTPTPEMIQNLLNYFTISKNASFLF